MPEHANLARQERLLTKLGPSLLWIANHVVQENLFLQNQLEMDLWYVGNARVEDFKI